MSYSILATASIVSALLALALAGTTVVLIMLRRWPWAHTAMTALLVVLGIGAVSAFFAGVESQSDLQRQSRQVASMAAAAELAAHALTGQYTNSVARLMRLSPALATNMRVNGAAVSLRRSRVIDAVRIRAWLGYGTGARLILRHGT
jgi:hypothetical protein